MEVYFLIFKHKIICNYLLAIDFWLYCIVVRKHVMYFFSSLKCIYTCHNLANLIKCFLYTWKCILHCCDQRSVAIRSCVNCFIQIFCTLTDILFSVWLKFYDIIPSSSDPTISLEILYYFVISVVVTLKISTYILHLAIDFFRLTL